MIVCMTIGPAGTCIIGTVSAVDPDRYYVSTTCDVSATKGVMAKLTVTNPGMTDNGRVSNFVNIQFDNPLAGDFIQLGWTKGFDTTPAYTVMFYCEIGHIGLANPDYTEVYPTQVPLTIGTTYTFYIYHDKAFPGVWRAVINGVIVQSIDTNVDNLWGSGPYYDGLAEVSAESNDIRNDMDGSVSDMQYGVSSRKGVAWKAWPAYSNVMVDWPYHIDRIDDFSDWDFYTDYMMLREDFTDFDKDTTTWSLDETGGTISLDYDDFYVTAPSLQLSRVGSDTTGGVSADHSLPMATTWPFYLDVSVKVDSTAICYILVRDTDGQPKVTFALWNGLFQWYDGSLPWNYVDGWTYEIDQWYTISIEVHPETHNYLVYANGQHYWCDMCDPDNDVPLGSVSFQAGWFDVQMGSVSYWVDHLVLLTDPDDLY